MGEYALGQPVPRFEDPRLIRGGGRYVDDLSMSGMVHGVVLRSQYAHAKLLSIDTSRALAAPGVLAVLTGKDWQASGYNDLPMPKGRKRRDGSPMHTGKFPALVVDKVRWVGDYVAFIVAETRLQALDAAELVDVRYEVLTPNVVTGEATDEGKPLVWDDCPNNISFVHLEGDKEKTDAAFAQADHVVRRKFVINRVTAATMEPRACIGHYDPAADRYTIHTTLQRAIHYRGQLARTLKVPESKVHVIAGDIGGSFGMKSGIYNEVGLVLLASRLVGRPVKWNSTRSEAFLSDAQARDNVTEAALALDKNGKFLGLHVKTIANVGAYLQPGGDGGATSNLGTLAGVYLTPAIHVDVTAVFTNTNPMRPYRGNGRPEAAYVLERMVDLAARELGLAPDEIRRRNLIPPDAMPYKTPLKFRYDSGEFEKGMDMVLKMSDWAGFEARRAESRKLGKLRGIGLSNSIEKAAAPGFEGAEIRFDRSGTVTILSGAVTQGQGHETVFKQLVCDRLGVKPDDVHYVQGDTDAVFFGEGTGGSRTATVAGSALHLAAEKVMAKAQKIAAKMLESDDIDFKDGIFTSRGTNRSLSINEVARGSTNPKNLPEGMEAGLIASAVYSNDLMNYPNGSHVCELEIDEETGKVDIVRYSVVDDVGNVLNPLILKGQIHGGVAQGVGQMLMEDLTYDPSTGELLAGSFVDYAMPHADNFCPIEVKSNPVPTATNPLGVKGAGEAGCVGALPAVANALADALSVYGIDDVPMPATSGRIWRMIQDAKAKRLAAE
ncbi:MAG: xanthine dehydrogenase family protein molybdopterin-binding subunit [Beijerinckiaceae bacterium]|nr:xanthine dehydrogenase family protein molybdopterin-binding subunit [Beijerinckiaceae bacterium]